jgi:hypothetical protein
MQVYDLKDADGRVFAFEVDNTGRRRLCRVVDSIPGVEVVRRPRLFSWLREDEFCEFDVDGVRFVAWEPHGDNSRYWVGPKVRCWAPQVSAVRDAFLQA